MIRGLFLAVFLVSTTGFADECETSCSEACRQKLARWAAIIGNHEEYCHGSTECSAEEQLLKSLLGINAAGCPENIAYADGRRAKQGPTWYQRSGVVAAVQSNGRLVWWHANGKVLKDVGGQLYHDNGVLAESNGGWLLYPNGKVARKRGNFWDWFYPEGAPATTNSGRTVIDRNGNPIASVGTETEIAAMVVPGFSCGFPRLHPFCLYFKLEDLDP